MILDRGVWRPETSKNMNQFGPDLVKLLTDQLRSADVEQEIPDLAEPDQVVRPERLMFLRRSVPDYALSGALHCDISSQNQPQWDINPGHVSREWIEDVVLTSSNYSLFWHQIVKLVFLLTQHLATDKLAYCFTLKIFRFMYASVP